MDLNPTRPSPPGAPPSVRVHIERLVVSGVDVRDRVGLGNAVQVELERLLTEHGWADAPEAAQQVARVQGGVIPAAPSRVAEFGARIAGAVYGGLTR